MRIALLAAALAACIPVAQTYKLEATSSRLLAAEDTTAVVAVPPADAAALVIEKLGARGFTLVAKRQTDAGLRLQLAGNRDYSAMGSTIGSVFYVWLEPVPVGTRIRIVGKPTVDHRESCPAFDGDTCTTIVIGSTWATSGVEEAQVIRGVFAQLALEHEPAPGDDAAPAAAGLTLRGCGGQLRWASQRR